MKQASWSSPLRLIKIRQLITQPAAVQEKEIEFQQPATANEE